MKKSVLLFSLLSGTALMLPNLAIASNINTHTNTPKPELSFEFAKLDNTLKIASVCFLGYGNCGDGDFSSGDDDYTLDTVKQCKNEGYVNSCASGYCLDHSCPYNASYGTCLVDNCPSNSSTSCTGSVVSQNNCGEDCKKCCDDTCKTGSKSYTGSVAGRTECGSTCYNCNTSCPSGSSTSYTGTSAGTNECGQTCRKCNNSCPAGYSTSTSTSTECYDTTTNECGTTCYKAKVCDPCAGYYECGGTWQYCEGSTCPADSSKCSVYCENDHFPYSCGSDYGPCYGDYRSGYCSVPCDKIETDPCDGVTGLSCSNGCASYGSCGQCTSCNSTPPSDPCEGVSCQSGVSCGSAGCASWSSSTSCCSSVCTSCNDLPPDDPCEGVTCPTAVSCGSQGCASYSSSTSCCSSVCTSCNADPCEGLTNQSCSYGCRTYYSSCPSKCQTCYSDNCHNRVAASCSNGCQSYYSDCSSKCQTCKPETVDCYAQYQSGLAACGWTGSGYCGSCCDSVDDAYQNCLRNNR